MLKKATYIVLLLMLVALPTIPLLKAAQPEDKRFHQLKKKPWYKSVWAKAGGMLTILGATAVTAFYIGKKSEEKGVRESSELYPRLSHALQKNYDIATALEKNIDADELKHILQQWVDKGNDINKDIIDYGSGVYLTPVMRATKSGNLTALRVLVKDFNANVNQSNKEDISPLMLAKNDETAAFLIKNGANVNFKGLNDVTPLMATITQPNPDVIFVDLLLKHGADVNAKMQTGDFPLMVAYLEYVNTESNNYNKKWHLMEILKHLLVAGADVDALDSEGDSVISAAQKGRWHDLYILFKPYSKKLGGG